MVSETPAARRLVCKVCYRSLPQASTGRPRLTCSDACRKHKSRQNSGYEWQMLRRRAARQIRRYEKRFGDLSLIPAYRNDPNETMSLRDRLMIYLPRGMRVLECWTCHRPYMPHGQLSPTCSDACTRASAEYFKRLHDNFYTNPRPMPPEIYDYIRTEERLKFCAHCDDVFVPTRPDRKYCSSKCRKLAYWHRRSHGYTRKAFGWKPLRKKCVECGKRYYPTTANKQQPQKYCSKPCLQRASDRHKLERKRASLPQRYCIHCESPLPKGKARTYCRNCAHLRSRDGSRRYRERQRLARPAPHHILST